jgi:hypothetical protein
MNTSSQVVEAVRLGGRLRQPKQWRRRAIRSMMAPMVTLLQTTDALKVTAVDALLRGEGIAFQTFDTAAGSLWTAIIPIRVMVAEEDQHRARRVLREAGFVEAGDGDWDLTRPTRG